jgi:hypothetical protein
MVVFTLIDQCPSTSFSLGVAKNSCALPSIVPAVSEITALFKGDFKTVYSETPFNQVQSTSLALPLLLKIIKAS